MSDQDDAGPDLTKGVVAADVADGQMLGGTVAGEPVVIVNEGGRICAWSGRCTHLGAPLATGLLVAGELRCPWHHARFSVATGEATHAPAFAPLQRFDVQQRDGKLFVTGKAASSASPARQTPSQQRIVIVGGGAAGYACAEMLNRHGMGHAVTVISDDADPPYDRTFCSKQYLIGMKSRDECALADPRLFRDGGPVLRLGVTVRRIDVKGREVVFDGDERLPFDALVLATGAEALRPNTPGFERPNVHLLRTLKDADALIGEAGEGKRAAVIGASFIGLEVAASLTQRKVEMHVVAPDDVPLKNILGAEVGRMIRGVHEEKGVRFHLGREAKDFDGRRLTLDDGSTLAVDFVVLGVGVKPRVELAAGAGLAVASEDDGGGVIVNEQLETSTPGIYAIGDVARYPDHHAGADIRVEHWVHAERQGQFVARHLLGQADRYDDLPFFWTAHFDTGLRYLGHVEHIADAKVDGSIGKRKFMIEYTGENDDKAFATCNRDLPALAVEAEWERPA